MKQLVCLLEEPSAKELLKVVLSKLLPETIGVTYIVFEGKQDLEKHLEKRMSGWRIPDTSFLVMRDQDSGDCMTIKNTLREKVNNSGKGGCSLIRIACRELESFYLGDLRAVEQGLDLNNIMRHQNSRKYQMPDKLANPSEELGKLTKLTYQKIQGSRNIAHYLNLDGSNLSHSFNVLISGIKNML